MLRTTFEVADVEVERGGQRRRPRAGGFALARPDVIVLDVEHAGTTGLELCAELKADPATRDIPIILLTGSDGRDERRREAAGADAFLRKPFSPLELLSVAERLAGGLYGVPFRATPKRSAAPEEELLLYARDLRHLLELERGQRELLQSAYLRDRLRARERARVEGHGHARALAARAELRDGARPRPSGTRRRHEDPSTPYGFLLHDVGKIGIPDGILQKPGPLSAGRAAADADAHGARRGDARRRRLPARARV